MHARELPPAWREGRIFHPDEEIIQGSVPELALRRALDTGLRLVSTEFLDELLDVMLRPKFARYVSATERHAFLGALAGCSELVEVSARIRSVPDPKDDKFPEPAIAGRADFLVTGGRSHLQPLDPFRGLRILSSRQLLDWP